MTTPLIDLPDAKAQLDATTTDDDAEIMAAVLAASEIINTECGYSVATEFTESITPSQDLFGRWTFVVTNTPLISVTSLTPQVFGQAPTGAVVTNPDAGIFTLPFGTWLTGPQTVVYTAGRDTVPDALQEACKFLVQWLWQSQRGAEPLPEAGLEGQATGYMSQGFPQQAWSLMRPYLRGPRV